MPTRIRHVTIDCHAPHSLARFWAPVLGFTDDPDDPNLLEHTEALIVDPTGQHPGLLFIGVPEPKTVKNRIHFDLQPEEGRDVTVDDLVARGATLVSDRRLPDGSGWVVLADPEGTGPSPNPGRRRPGATIPTGSSTPRPTSRWPTR